MSVEWDPEVWLEQDGACTGCGVLLGWEADPPEHEDDAVCIGCLYKQRDAARAELRELIGTLPICAQCSDVSTQWQIYIQSADPPEYKCDDCCESVAAVDTAWAAIVRRHKGET